MRLAFPRSGPRTCTKCKATKPPEEFDKRHDGCYRKACRACAPPAKPVVPKAPLVPLPRRTQPATPEPTGRVRLDCLPPAFGRVVGVDRQLQQAHVLLEQGGWVRCLWGELSPSQEKKR